ncbi:MAG: FAD-dependent oxidoreductase [Rhodomicrobium sp.]|nr:FAD-dependent oxidoreductase [Rhodomicrobium sp.]
MNEIPATCCIIGGGPAGMMTGYLLARAGISVVVLEKHTDFLRDFRGDTIHPSTLQIMDELGLYDRLLARPHHKAYALKGRFGAFETIFADFSHLPRRAKFIAFMPQWDFLNFLAEEAGAYPCFKLMMGAVATDFAEEGGKIAGVLAETADGPLRVLSGLVIGCDGRHAMTRAKAALPAEDIGAPMDVLWFRVSRRGSDPEEPVGSFGPGNIFIMINRGDYWQCGYVIAKGSLGQIRECGLKAFQDGIEKLAPFLDGRSKEVTDLSELKLLTVLQVRIQNNVITGVLGQAEAQKPPLLLRLIKRFPWLARIPARVVGLGFRPEHVDCRIFADAEVR